MIHILVSGCSKIYFISILWCLIACNTTTKCDDFFTHRRAIMFAYLAFESGDYDNAFIKFKKALEIKPKENVTDDLFFASSAFHLGKYDVAEQILSKAVTVNNCDREYLETFSELVQFHKMEQYSRVISNYDSLVNVYWETNDLKLMELRLDEMLVLDQKYRNGGDDEARDKVDSSNILQLKELVEEYGWHPKGWLILWHQRGSYPNGENWPFFIEAINEGIERCQISPSFWTHFDEYISMRDSSKQIYGYYPQSFAEFPLKNVDKVDSLREAKGLQPLWFMHHMYDRPLPEGYPAPLQSQSKF